ncbi:MAG: MBL fold metallo-hydrolase [Bacilli bacterium]|nr:MBL fold metallo-hydrolase [Bacilli bacterium]
MKIKVIASGSKGNSTLIESKGTKILIDVGVNYQRIKKTLDNNNIDINEIDGIIISHTHSDHIGGLSSVIKKINTKVFIKEELFGEIKKIINIDNIEIVEDKFVTIGNLDIEYITASHDVPAYGFIIGDGEKRVLYLTDTGYINRKYYEISKNLDAYIIESNHDEKMLMDGPYPYILKQRVISDKGHLSNRYTGKYLNKTIGKNTKYIILAHLSEKNNTRELALEQVKDELKDNKYFNNNIIIANQHEETELVVI